MKTVIILRGAPGAGKSSLSTLLSVHAGAKIVSTDKHLQVDGRYDWSPAALLTAHEKCFADFTSALCMEREIIVVDNCNSRSRDMARYAASAKAHGYVVRQIIVENTHGGRSVHNVPEHIVERAKQRIRSNIQL